MTPPPIDEAARKILRPEDLDLPPQAAEVMSALTDEGAVAFSQEIVAALIQAQMKGDFRPVRDVVDAWYRTLLAVRHPDHAAAVVSASKLSGKKAVPLSQLERDLEDRMSAGS